MLFTHTNKLKIPDLANTKTNSTENYQDNGSTTPLGTQPSSLYSPLIDTLVAPADPLPRLHIENRDTAILGRMVDPPNVRRLGADGMLFGVYHNWVHQNTGNHMDDGITEDGKWQARWGKLVCMSTQCYNTPSGKFRRRFVRTLSVELDGVQYRKWNSERVIIF